MALKPDRVEFLTDLSFFMNVTGERGLIVIHDTGGSGSAMDDSNAKVKIPTANADASGNAAGLLLNDVVNIDLTRQHINYAKDEVQKGGKVLILREGTVVTNLISGTPTVGAKAYYDANGHLTSVQRYESKDAQSTQVGRFLSTKDADGYAKVAINIV